MKYLYKPSLSYYERIREAVMRIMVMSVTNGIPHDELFPATNMDREFGIFYSNDRGGKLFWTYEQLEDLYVRKNNEFKRFKR